MAEFRLRFITEGDFVSNAIRAVTSSEWSHAEIVLPDGSYLGAHASGGVLIRPADYCIPKRERRYSIPVEDAALEKMLAFAHAQVGKPYNFTDIAGILFHSDWNSVERWICSELVTAIAAAGGLQMLNVQNTYYNKVTPEMLHLSPYLIGRCYFSEGC